MDSADQGLYDDGAPAATAEAAPDTGSEENSGGSNDYPTAVVSKDAFGSHDIQPGSSFAGKILRVNDADVEVQITECDSGEASSEGPPAPESDMGAMME